MPRPAKAIAKQRLQRALDGIEGLRQVDRSSPEFTVWHRNTRLAIESTFVDLPSRVEEFTDIEFTPRVSWYSEDRAARRHTAYVTGLESAAATLSSMIHEIEEYWDDQESGSHETLNTSERNNTNQVFLIHGRDPGTRDTVARFLETLGLEPVILQEQPDQGRTIIEKFEQHAQCDFAVALFTPDDVGGLAEDGLRSRVRQNVVFELGYFIGKFSRDRVRVLVKGAPEIPSDYSGVLYIQLDEAEGWKLALGRELRDSGFEIEAKRIF